jgi:hypothetical protein
MALSEPHAIRWPNANSRNLTQGQLHWNLHFLQYYPNWIVRDKTKAIITKSSSSIMASRYWLFDYAFMLTKLLIQITNETSLFFHTVIMSPFKLMRMAERKVWLSRLCEIGNIAPILQSCLLLQYIIWLEHYSSNPNRDKETCRSILTLLCMQTLLT